MSKKILVLLVSLCGVLSCLNLASAEEAVVRADDIRSKLPADGPAKGSKLELSTFFEAPMHSFLISTEAGRVDSKAVGQRVQYSPTFGPNVGVRAAYEVWSLSYSRRLSFVEGAEVAKYGKTDYDDWRLGARLSKNLLLETYYQNYRGFYADLSGREGLRTEVRTQNTFAGPVSGTENTIISRPDINALNYGLRVTYVLPLMELARALASEKDKAGLNWEFNFLTKAYYNRLAITGDRPLIPDTIQGAFSPIASLREYWAHTAGAGVGIGAEVPMGSPAWTFGMSGLLGAGIQRQTAVFKDRDSSAVTLGQELNAEMYIDWKGLNHGFRWGIYLDNFSSKVDEIHFDSMNLGFNLLYSYSGIVF